GLTLLAGCSSGRRAECCDHAGLAGRPGCELDRVPQFVTEGSREAGARKLRVDRDPANAADVDDRTKDARIQVDDGYDGPKLSSEFAECPSLLMPGAAQRNRSANRCPIHARFYPVPTPSPHTSFPTALSGSRNAPTPSFEMVHSSSSRWPL